MQAYYLFFSLKGFVTRVCVHIPAGLSMPLARKSMITACHRNGHVAATVHCHDLRLHFLAIFVIIYGAFFMSVEQTVEPAVQRLLNHSSWKVLYQEHLPRCEI
jgi:hypothetical protein